MAGIPGECEVTTLRDEAPISSRLAIELKTAREFSCPSVDNLRGSVSTQHRQLLQAILDETSIRIQVTCELNNRNNGARKTSRLLPQLISCSLSINLYGPKELFEEIGTFFQDYDIYLQDPLDCDMNVRYCNPHRLSSTDPSLCPLTYDLKTNMLEAFEIQPKSRHSELLDNLDPQEDLPEASQPPEIQTQLERYAKSEDLMNLLLTSKDTKNKLLASCSEESRDGISILAGKTSGVGKRPVMVDGTSYSYIEHMSTT